MSLGHQVESLVSPDNSIQLSPSLLFHCAQQGVTEHTQWLEPLTIGSTPKGQRCLSILSSVESLSGDILTPKDALNNNKLDIFQLQAFSCKAFMQLLRTCMANTTPAHSPVALPSTTSSTSPLTISLNCIASISSHTPSYLIKGGPHHHIILDHNGAPTAPNTTSFSITTTVPNGYFSATVPSLTAMPHNSAPVTLASDGDSSTAASFAPSPPILALQRRTHCSHPGLQR